MEELKAYMESGILELYVLGQLNAQEQAEVEAMAAKYPEIKQELEAIEIAMEQYAQQQAVEPSAALKSKILNQISQEPVKDITLPAPTNYAAYESKIRTLRIALAACASLLVVSGVMLYQTHNQLGNAKDQIASLSLEKEQFTTTVSHMRQTNNDLQKIADMPNDPDWKVVKLAGTKMDPSAKMIVYWHISGRHVMVDNSKMGLPANDKAHQYQLWALVNGKPVDLGVFDVKADSTHLLLQMKEIASAQAFAVTLEKRGGSPIPTMDKMVVMGGVSI
ncbi:anti-sigma-K factor RskA [Pedobacter africanus]|uniref:Anti-sigma-K factor RskA n=1 Tax=Pedobacter africanus TaxID=151894 RepID=A0ACC6L1V8_9SPHI|nr:anti-sigma factor [Pedobacter africanus]MDR6785400.1 anti-sigma-K factor RskA [Pedobacter africanus]